MYTIKRQKQIKEQLQICNPDGTEAMVLDVDLNVDEVTNRVSKAWDALGAAQIELQKSPDDPRDMDAYGRAVIAVFDVIFGPDNSKKLLEFYEGHYSEMLLDVFPFLTNVVMPQIRDASNARKEQLLEAAKKMK